MGDCCTLSLRGHRFNTSVCCSTSLLCSTVFSCSKIKPPLLISPASSESCLIWTTMSPKSLEASSRYCNGYVSVVHMIYVCFHSTLRTSVAMGHSGVPTTQHTSRTKVWNSCLKPVSLPLSIFLTFKLACNRVINITASICAGCLACTSSPVTLRCKGELSSQQPCRSDRRSAEIIWMWPSFGALSVKQNSEGTCFHDTARTTTSWMIYSLWSG